MLTLLIIGFVIGWILFIAWVVEQCRRLNG